MLFVLHPLCVQCFLRLSNLRVLRMSGNRLTHVPDDLDRLSRLEELVGCMTSTARYGWRLVADVVLPHRCGL